MIDSGSFKDKDTRYNTIQVYIIGFLALLPTTTIFVYVKFALVLLLTAGNILANRTYISKKSIIVYLLWGVNIVLSFTTVLMLESSFNINLIIHEIQRLIFYLLLYLLCSSFRVKLTTLANICRLLLLINLGVQLLQYFRIGNTYSFLYNYYLPPGEGTAHLDMAYWVENGYFRSGSIFLNPNVYVLYPIIFELVFLQKMNDKHGIFDYFWLISCVISIYLTGSRTGLILFVTVYIYSSINNKRFSLDKLILPIILIIGFVFLASSFGNDMGARIFQLSDGVSGSTGVKLEGFKWYLKAANPAYWLFGSLGSNNQLVVIDMEFGHIFVWFGVLGLYWYIKLIQGLADVNKDIFKMLSRGMQIVIVLTAFSSSTILNMSVFPFISLIAYSEIMPIGKGMRDA